MKKHLLSSFPAILLSSMGFMGFCSFPSFAMDTHHTPSPYELAKSGTLLNKVPHDLDPIIHSNIYAKGLTEFMKKLHELNKHAIYFTKKDLEDIESDIKNKGTLSLMGIETIPQEIGNLKMLTSLTISASDIKTLPDDIKHLTNLKHISITHCGEITNLPSTFGSLSNLETLDISYTNIGTIPGLKDLKKLREIVVEENHTFHRNFPEFNFKDKLTEMEGQGKKDIEALWNLQKTKYRL